MSDSNSRGQRVKEVVEKVDEMGDETRDMTLEELWGSDNPWVKAVVTTTSAERKERKDE